MPFPGLAALILQFLGELLFAGYRINHPLAGAVDVFLHLADQMLDHPFWIFDPIHQIVEIGVNDVADALEQTGHEIPPKSHNCVTMICILGHLILVEQCSIKIKRKTLDEVFRIVVVT